ncbi:MAG: hypothetical protein ABI586_05840 [Candidatus Nanopelagicales bacterium]
MNHLSDGVLRRFVDEPEGLADNQREHLQDCDRCSRAVAELRRDRVAVESVLSSTSDANANIDLGWQRLQDSLSSNAPKAATVSVPRRPLRLRLMKAPVLAAAGALLVIGGATAAAANDWLTIFQPESITPVAVNVSELAQLPDLSSFGRWDLKTDPALVDVPDASAASSQTGMSVLTPTVLPTGVDGTPTFQVMTKQTATFTFSQQKAAATATAAGESLPPLPPGLDGTVLRLELGPAVVQSWAQQTGAPTLLIARVGAPLASSNGIPLATFRDALLSLPGLPDDVAAQLRAVTGDGTTLPLPVPSNEFTSTSADVSGAPATVLTSRDRTLAGVVWLDNGVVTIVAGPLDAQEVLLVARDLG